MKIIYSATVEIDAAPLILKRTFHFETAIARDCFVADLPEGTRLRGQGIEHLVTIGEALDEIRCERESVR